MKTPQDSQAGYSDRLSRLGIFTKPTSRIRAGTGLRGPRTELKLGVWSRTGVRGTWPRSGQGQSVSMSSLTYSFLLLLLFYEYLFLREREREYEQWRNREGDTESEAGSRLWASAQSPTRGSNPQTARSWPEPNSDTQPTEPPRCPKHVLNKENLGKYQIRISFFSWYPFRLLIL